MWMGAKWSDVNGRLLSTARSEYRTPIVIALHVPMASPLPTLSTITYHTLPPPRSSGPLKPGSRSESNLITYLDDQILQVSRKYAKKYHEGGYATIEAVVKDLERLVDILWISSTRLSLRPFLSRERAKLT